MIRKAQMIMAWVLVGACILGIFLIAPLARTIQRVVADQWSRSAFGYLVMVAVIFAAFLLGHILYVRLKIRRFWQYFWLALILGAYVYFTLSLWEAPEEAVHFLYYGLLAFFLLRALRFHIQDKSIYISALFIGTLVGIVDEIIQWMLPDRYWDIRDIGLNALACLLFLIAVWAGVRPHGYSKKVTPRSVRIASVFFAVNLVLFGLCFSNTPQRVKGYAKALPFLSYLEKEEAMSEFKHRHRDPEIGLFYSRLTIEEIKKMDRERARGTAKVLRDWQTKPYKEYLRTFPGHVHPFLYEIRVHIFRRDARLERGEESNDPKIKKENRFIAFKENLILEKYFEKSLKLSPYAWSPEKKESISSDIEIKRFYKSPVGAGVFAGLRESTVWLVILMLLLLLAGFNAWFTRCRQDQ